MSGVGSATITVDDEELHADVVNVSFGGCALHLHERVFLTSRTKVTVAYNGIANSAVVRYVVSSCAGGTRVGLEWLPPAHIVNCVFVRNDHKG